MKKSSLHLVFHTHSVRQSAGRDMSFETSKKTGREGWPYVMLGYGRMTYWLVVSNIFHFHPYSIWGRFPF